MPRNDNWRKPKSCSREEAILLRSESCSDRGAGVRDAVRRACGSHATSAMGSARPDRSVGVVTQYWGRPLETSASRLANQTRVARWSGTASLAKKWNDHHDKPVKPSFLLEVMALDLLALPWGGSYPRELRQFFASATASLDEE